MCVSHLGRYTQSRRSFQGVFLLRGGWGGLVAGHAAAPTCRLLRRFQVLIYVLQPDCSDQTDCSRFSSRLFGLFKNDVLLLPETEEADQSADSISAVNQQCVCVCVCVCCRARRGRVSERVPGQSELAFHSSSFCASSPPDLL